MAESVRAFGLLAGAWIRSSMAYRTSFVTLTLSNAAITFLDFAIVLIIFSHLDAFGGFTLAQLAVLYAMSGLAIGVADLLLGNAELLGQRVRDGSLDQMMCRPVPTLVQVAADRFALRRLGRILQAFAVLVWALSSTPIDWTPLRVLVMLAALASGALIFCSLFVLGGAFQVFAGDASEVSNAFTYGGNTLTQYPLGIYPVEVVRGVTFIVPLAFVNWYPALYLLGLDDPFGFPAWFQFASPVVAALFVGVAALGWRVALRHYRSAGS
uniref:Putative integral membrane transport protein n=1 Tax=uncultured Nocardioidaceae bacterium TaxID=253824 RepID=A0A6J4KXR3_9ACTN|nr:MAG: putative integral membrane transport protein [uncultured Nocardioidaceae bacterium]